jgi:hypothetical protein
MGRAVHAAARVKGGALWVPGAGHNDVDDVGGDPYWRWVEQALVPEGALAGDAGGAGQSGRPARP